MEMIIYFIVFAIPAVSGLILPWLMVRQGYREPVLLVCFITSVLCLALIAGIIGQSSDYSVMMLFAGAATYAALLAVNSGLSLWLSRSKR
ncbi:hypothetical protein FZI27_20300 [Cronobacter sakazakii]|nr:hypothetical protein FZI27_20300 [Cronobacter sakazakii]